MSMFEGEGLNPGAFIAGLIQEDIGVTAGRNLLREAGMRMSNEAFSNLYGQVRDAIGGREALQGLDYSAVPQADQYSTWAAGEGGQYSTFVTTFVRPEGSRDPESVFYFYTTDEPHSPDEAIDAAGAFIDEGGDANPAYGPRTIVGAVVTSVNRTVAKR